LWWTRSRGGSFGGRAFWSSNLARLRYPKAPAACFVVGKLDRRKPRGNGGDRSGNDGDRHRREERGRRARPRSLPESKPKRFSTNPCDRFCAKCVWRCITSKRKSALPPKARALRSQGRKPGSAPQFGQDDDPVFRRGTTEWPLRRQATPKRPSLLRRQPSPCAGLFRWRAIQCDTRGLRW